MNKTILFVMSGNWDAGLMSSYRRAFESLGWRVVTFDLEAARLLATPATPVVGHTIRRLLPYLDFPSITAKANRTLATKALELDPAAVVVSCNEPVRAGTLAYLRVALPRTKLCAIFPDTLFNLRENVLQALPLYDVFATHTKAGLDALSRLGCRAPFYLPLAADPELHHPEPLLPADRREYGCDLVYVGNWRTEHERLFDDLEPLDIAIWGSHQWLRARPGSWARRHYRGRPLLTGLEYAKAHCAAKVALNPIDPLNFPGHNMRAFELPACRVFSLVTRTAEIQELFEEGKTIACFGDAAELKDKIRYYLDRPEERQRIADAAYEHVVNGGHTYRDRARTLLREVGLGVEAG